METKAAHFLYCEDTEVRYFFFVNSLLCHEIADASVHFRDFKHCINYLNK